MSFQITVTEKEILETPNYFELGKLINNKYWQAKRDLEGPQFDDEHVGLTINEDGLVTSITRSDDYDTCVVCGKKSPYLRSTHIDMRFFYVEGSGQLCEDCYKK